MAYNVRYMLMLSPMVGAAKAHLSCSSCLFSVELEWELEARDYAKRERDDALASHALCLSETIEGCGASACA